MAYHLKSIDKGILGNVSKIKEEFLEFEDAANQNARIMELLELSDLYGAIESYLEKNHPSFKMADLAKMSDLTKSAFRDKTRR